VPGLQLHWQLRPAVPGNASEVLMGAGVLNREVERVSTPQYGYGPATVA
jgi:hypothetical protein